MAFIKVQNLSRDKDGSVTAGTASIVDTVYVADGKYHSKQVIREALGKVLSLSMDKRSGVFLSQRRGPVRYDAASDTFQPLSAEDKASLNLAGEASSVNSLFFGDAFWLVRHLERSGLMDVLKKAFPDKEARDSLLAHLCCRMLPGGQDRSFADFMQHSFAGVLFPQKDASKAAETSLFLALGSRACLESFSSAMAEFLRAKNAGCGWLLADTRPLPWSTLSSPENLKGEGSTLQLVLEQESGWPVWFDTASGDDRTPSLLSGIASSLSGRLSCSIEGFALDSCYISKDFVKETCSDKKDFIALMPLRKDFQYKEAFREEVRPYLGKSKFEFTYEGRTFFGRKVPLTLFGRSLFLYHYVDAERAARGLQEFTRCYPDEFESLGGFKKDWLANRFGYFVLVSSRDLTEEQLLADYCRQTAVYDRLAAIPKGASEPVRRGRILFACLQCCLEQSISEVLAGKGMSCAELFAKTQALLCLASGSGTFLVETPSQEVSSCFELLDMKVPACVQAE